VPHRRTGSLAVILADIRAGAAAVLLVVTGPRRWRPASRRSHIYPVWLGFKGGKGVAAASGVFGVLAPGPPRSRPVAFGVTVARTRFVSLADRGHRAPAGRRWSTPGLRSVDISATVVATLILFRHRGNLARLWTRTERALGT
jgi:glycerol-3-phosphate acyltransferase PlsY